MTPTPEDLPRQEFGDEREFVTTMCALLAERRWYWRPAHQLSHEVSEMEAVNFLRLATARMVRRDRRWTGRWRVDGMSPLGRRIGVSCSIWLSPAGPLVYIVSAFAPGDP